MSDREKSVLIAMYGSYALICELFAFRVKMPILMSIITVGAIGVDMFYRIQKVLEAAASLREQKKAL